MKDQLIEVIHRSGDQQDKTAVDYTIAKENIGEFNNVGSTGLIGILQKRDSELQELYRKASEAGQQELEEEILRNQEAMGAALNMRRALNPTSGDVDPRAVEESKQELAAAVSPEGKGSVWERVRGWWSKLKGAVGDLFTKKIEFDGFKKESSESLVPLNNAPAQSVQVIGAIQKQTLSFADKLAARLKPDMPGRTDTEPRQNTPRSNAGTDAASTARSSPTNRILNCLEVVAVGSADTKGQYGGKLKELIECSNMIEGVEKAKSSMKSLATRFIENPGDIELAIKLGVAAKVVKESDPDKLLRKAQACNESIMKELSAMEVIDLAGADPTTTMLSSISRGHGDLAEELRQEKLLTPKAIIERLRERSRELMARIEAAVEEPARVAGKESPEQSEHIVTSRVSGPPIAPLAPGGPPTAPPMKLGGGPPAPASGPPAAPPMRLGRAAADEVKAAGQAIAAASPGGDQRSALLGSLTNSNPMAALKVNREAREKAKAAAATGRG